MNHRPLSVIVLVTVVMLAGCSGGIPFTDDGSSANGTTTQPAATATQTGTGVEAELNNVSFPPGYSASGITNPERAVTHHFSALFSHDNFTYTTKGPIFTTGRFTIVFRIDLAEKRIYGTSDVTAPDRRPRYVEEYRIENTSYVARFHNGTPRYFFTTTGPFMPYVSTILGKSLDDPDMLSQMVRNVRFGNATRVTRNGETLIQYESTALLNKTPLLPVQAANATVNEFNASILVGEGGIIRMASYSISYTKSNGRQLTMSGTTRISRIDATTIEEPAWLDKAKAQTDQSTTEFGNTTTTETNFAVESPADMPSHLYTQPSVQDKQATASVR